VEVSRAGRVEAWAAARCISVARAWIRGAARARACRKMRERGPRMERAGLASASTFCLVGRGRLELHFDEEFGELRGACAFCAPLRAPFLVISHPPRAGSLGHIFVSVCCTWRACVPVSVSSVSVSFWFLTCLVLCVGCCLCALCLWCVRRACCMQACPGPGPRQGHTEHSRGQGAKASISKSVCVSGSWTWEWWVVGR
jgi:hypothetical protein